MQGILIIVLWAVAVITSIAGYFVWENSKKLEVQGKMSKNNKDIIHKYGYLRLITLFVLISLFVIAVVSLLEATETQNYFKF